MPPVFSTTDPDCLAIVRGAGRIDHAPYVTGGADGSPFTYFGQIQAGGLAVNIQSEEYMIDGEEGRAPCDSFVTKEKITITGQLLEGDIEKTNRLYGADGSNTTTVVDTTTTMGGGNIHAGGVNSGNRPLYQIILRSPNEVVARDTLKLGYWQIWKCLMRITGDIQIARDTPAILPFEIVGLWDFSFDAVAGDKGNLFRRVVTL
jgi:hypothetical protein